MDHTESLAIKRVAEPVVHIPNGLTHLPIATIEPNVVGNLRARPAPIRPEAEACWQAISAES
jgi:hypothetical protein